MRGRPASGIGSVGRTDERRAGDSPNGAVSRHSAARSLGSAGSASSTAGQTVASGSVASRRIRRRVGAQRPHRGRQPSPPNTSQRRVAPSPVRPARARTARSLRTLQEQTITRFLPRLDRSGRVATATGSRTIAAGGEPPCRCRCRNCTKMIVIRKSVLRRIPRSGEPRRRDGRAARGGAGTAAAAGHDRRRMRSCSTGGGSGEGRIPRARGTRGTDPAARIVVTPDSMGARNAAGGKASRPFLRPARTCRAPHRAPLGPTGAAWPGVARRRGGRGSRGPAARFRRNLRVGSGRARPMSGRRAWRGGVAR